MAEHAGTSVDAAPPEFGEWRAHVETDEVRVDPTAVSILQAIYDDNEPLRAGDPLPALWHWVALPRWVPTSSLAVDGHSAKGGLLPPVRLPRRMFAGGDVRIHHPLKIGTTVRRERKVTSIAQKNGRSGQLTIVRLETRLRGEDGVLALDERQDLVYRAAVKPSQGLDPQPRDAVHTSPTAATLERVAPWTWDFRTNPTTLMRFSAATANAHRIHYDWPYATQIEGYPGLVVHGPLMSLSLAEAFRRESPGVTISRITHRNRAPLFCNHPAQVLRDEQDTDAEVRLALVSARSVRSSLTVTVG